jgi:TatD DNase family protein
MTSCLVDFHCHLDLFPDFESLVSECDQLGIHTLAVTTTPRAWHRNHELATRTNFVHAALGLHPQLAETHFSELNLWDSLLPHARFVGEVGLDAGPRYFRTLDQQKRIFEHVLRTCSRQGGKILSVHSVRSVTPVLEMIEKHVKPGTVRVVLHWFTGSMSEARRAEELGCYFSVNTQMATTPRLAKIIENLPQGRLLTETDGPFVLINGQPSKPKNVSESLRALANARKVSDIGMRDIVSHNYKALIESF